MIIHKLCVLDISFLTHFFIQFSSLLHGAVSNLMDNNSDPSISEQSGHLAANQTIMNQITADRLEKNEYKIPILSNRETDLTKINPRMWWEQISEYIHLTCNRNLDELMDQGIDQMDPHTVYHIKGDVIWALGPKAKHEIMRGLWGKELKDLDLPELLKLFKKTFIPARIPQFLLFHSYTGRNYHLQLCSSYQWQKSRRQIHKKRNSKWSLKPSNKTTTTANTETRRQIKNT